MDGLLVDTEPVWAKAWIATLATVGVQLTPKMTEETQALKIEAVVDYWYQRYPWPNVDSPRLQKLVVEQMELLNKRGAIVVMPGALATIRFFINHAFPIAVASSSPLHLIDSTLNAIGVRDDFKVICSAEAERNGKSEPDVFLTAARKLGVPPQKALVLEDSENGMLAARRAGMLCLGVNSNATETMKQNATILLSSLEEFNVEVFDRLNKHKKDQLYE